MIHMLKKKSSCNKHDIQYIQSNLQGRERKKLKGEEHTEVFGGMDSVLSLSFGYISVYLAILLPNTYFRHIPLNA